MWSRFSGLRDLHPVSRLHPRHSEPRNASSEEDQAPNSIQSCACVRIRPSDDGTPCEHQCCHCRYMPLLSYIRRAPSGENTGNRRPLIGVKTFRYPFRADHFRQHLVSQHHDKWLDYQKLEKTKDQADFFAVPVSFIETMPAHFAQQNEKLMFSFDKRIVEDLIGALLLRWNSTRMMTKCGVVLAVCLNYAMILDHILLWFAMLKHFNLRSGLYLWGYPLDKQVVRLQKPSPSPG